MGGVAVALNPAAFEIRTFDDLVRALRARPEWKEELRRLILTDALLALPQKFEDFREHEFRPLQAEVHAMRADMNALRADVDTLTDRVARLEQDVAVLKEDVKQLKEDVRQLKGDVKQLKDDVGRLKGIVFEQRVREKAPAYFGRLMRRVRVLSASQVARALDDAADQGLVSEDERWNTLQIDVVVRGRLSSGAERVLAVEVSHVVDRKDVERAARRAEVLERALNFPTVGVVLGHEVTQGGQQAADEQHVLVIQRVLEV